MGGEAGAGQSFSVGSAASCENAKTAATRARDR